jgi:hypothetical protein
MHRCLEVVSGFLHIVDALVTAFSIWKRGTRRSQCHDTAITEPP